MEAYVTEMVAMLHLHLRRLGRDANSPVVDGIVVVVAVVVLVAVAAGVV
jgi:uncharacterized RDD family membrane protein YckC